MIRSGGMFKAPGYVLRGIVQVDHCDLFLVELGFQVFRRNCVFHSDLPKNLSDSYTAIGSGLLSAERASLGIGMLTITEVPEAFDSIFISPWN